ncbi:S8 family peptidase [Sphingobacterium endophyticum]|uniref:S8 family peptidase n=1 Tax=Sphingobacterium endophyticum TaxID=2546448 RepID=UPI0012E1779B|nr:S8 family peptidase [Sphingobacterium endophyticum]
MRNRIVYLNNNTSAQIGFSKQRNMKDAIVKKEAEEEIEQKIISESKKIEFHSYLTTFNKVRQARREQKSIYLPFNIELVRINFLTVFNSNLSKKFLLNYGLSPIEYLDFNKTVVFTIDDREAFENFLIQIGKIIDSPVGTNYYKKKYNLLALVYKFEFYSSNDRLNCYQEEGILITFISTHLAGAYDTQKNILLEHLHKDEISISYDENYPDILEILFIPKDKINLIVDNFDIVKSVTSSRSQKVRPSLAGPVREYGFTVNVPKNIPIVGIIDTGISRIEPFKNSLLTENFNHTTQPSFWDEDGHGTLVTGLVLLGDEFYKIEKNQYDAKAKILNIKALHFSDDNLDIPRLINDIISARKLHGVRIFNMSLVIPNAKKYNSSYSQFAYELDRIAFQYDLLIFLSVGNFDSDSLLALKNDYIHEDHDYPVFFYKLNSSTDSHMCEDTNICIPSESLNNISVGALAGNFDEDDKSDITPSNIYPAHYSRKFHFDYNRQVNGQKLQQKNKFLNKPDFVMEGGDLFDYNSGIQILRSPNVESEKFYGKTCGTSLATPLLTSYAAEILTHYPEIRTQSVKALLINSAEYYESSRLTHFEKFHPNLLKRLVGYGKPNKDYLLSTNNNSIIYLIEGSIKVEQIIKYPIFIPSYLLNNGNKLQFDISLAYSFDPIKDDHLNYLPLHMSFSLVKNLDIKSIGTTKDVYGIKSQFGWSEDHFGIDNRLFSNTQKISYRLQPVDINNCKDSVAIAVRCLAKKDFLNTLKHSEHYFSLVIRISEIMTNENTPGIEFYNEIMKINNYLDIANIIEGDLDLEF